ncbi:MAG TPA: ABC transporter permease [Dehalococcoidia bacterium]|jgi:NitT/TauT family transport system permease protein
MLQLNATRRSEVAVADAGREPAASAGERALARRGAVRLWGAVWPRLAAVGIVLIAWQGLVWARWRPAYVLPGPLPVLRRLAAEAGAGTLFSASAVTLQRALIGYAIALVIGTALGLAVASVPLLRTAVGALVAGLQSMPSVAWFPLAILLFKLSEAAILFVVVLGAAPAIANGLIAAIDHVPPPLLRAGRVLGARRIALYRHVILPAALPGFVAGMKQGWAFAWRSLLAGELLVIIANRPSIGVRLQFARDFSDAAGLLSWMIVILVIGALVEGLVFAPLQRRLLLNRGLIEAAG